MSDGSGDYISATRFPWSVSIHCFRCLCGMRAQYDIHYAASRYGDEIWVDVHILSHLTDKKLVEYGFEKTNPCRKIGEKRTCL